MSRANNRPALVLAIAATVLWQLTAELRFLLAHAGVAPSGLVPTGSLFSVLSVAHQPRLPGVLGLLLGLTVMFVVVLVQARVVTRRGAASKVVAFLAFWMVVVIGGFIASAITYPILLAFQRFPLEFWPQQLGQIAWSPYWGVVVGWIAALIAAAGVRPTASAPMGGNPAPVGTYPGAAGYPGSLPSDGDPGAPGAAIYPNIPPADAASSPYATGPRD